MRDPAKAILAEFNRQSGGHIGFASPDRYKRTKGRCEYYFKFKVSFKKLKDICRFFTICYKKALGLGTNESLMG